MYTLSELRDMVLNYLGITDTKDGLAKIIPVGITQEEYLNQEINRSYIEVAREFGYVEDLIRNINVNLSLRQRVMKLDNVSEIQSVFINNSRVDRYDLCNSSIFYSYESTTEILFKSTNPKELYFYETNAPIEESLVLIDSSENIVGICDVSGEIRDNQNIKIAQFSYDNIGNRYSIIFISTPSTNITHARFRTSSVGTPFGFCKVRDRTFILSSALNDNTSTATILCSIIPYNLLVNSDSTIFSLTELDIMLCIDTTYRVALRIGSDEFIDKYNTLRLQQRERISAKSINI